MPEVKLFAPQDEKLGKSGPGKYTGPETYCTNLHANGYRVTGFAAAWRLEALFLAVAACPSPGPGRAGQTELTRTKCVGIADAFL
jgi:hypothetical protein